ncbi:unnamed protein product [Psylliodes chrysocephalus]|uniref:Uncharacterized protein n=1 Tax=Psylliodes chrysocephalus TaxID=3402493 RepID=A0A9P0D0M8_9CUCU|nr:unnamed protein product [Psylliodes chrysocephala]
MIISDSVMHVQHLVAKNLSSRFHESLQFVISSGNRIRSNALNTRLFAPVVKKMMRTFINCFLLLHTEVHWLLKGSCLTRFFAFFGPLLEAKYPILKQSSIR